MTVTILSEIKKNRSRIFRRAYLKRRDATTGLFESSWQEISSDVEKWGTLKKSADFLRSGKVTLGDLIMKLQNIEGRFNPEDDEASIWYGYSNPQRTLVKIEAGFVHQTLGSNGIWTNTELPTSAVAFMGIVSGDISVSDANSVNLPVKPLMHVFRDFPARNLTGWTSTGFTASQFMNMLWNQTDGAGSFIFRPFFQDTTTYWNVTATSNIYSNLNTSTAADIVDKDVYDVIEKLAEAEDMIAYITPEGAFKFRTKEVNTTGVQYSFFGRGNFDTEYGHTIKKVNRYGRKMSNFYSRVEVKWIDSNTSTAIRVRESALAINGTNTSWNFGVKTYRFENFWIPTSTVADTILENIFTTASSLKSEIEFSTSFIPHLNLFDRIAVSYDSSEPGIESRWDLRDWGLDTTVGAEDLYWDNSKGDAIRLVADEFKLLSVEVNLDNLESKFVAREI